MKPTKNHTTYKIQLRSPTQLNNTFSRIHVNLFTIYLCTYIRTLASSRRHKAWRRRGYWTPKVGYICVQMYTYIYIHYKHTSIVFPMSHSLIYQCPHPLTLQTSVKKKRTRKTTKKDRGSRRTAPHPTPTNQRTHTTKDTHTTKKSSSTHQSPSQHSPLLLLPRSRPCHSSSTSSLNFRTYRPAQQPQAQ